MAGFLGGSEDWFEVERHWEKRVKDEGLAYFRATECFSLTGQFNELVKKHGPYVFCFHVPYTTTQTRSISILLGGSRYPIGAAARLNFWSSQSTAQSHGSITNKSDVSNSR